MSYTMMGYADFRKLESKTWKIASISKHYHHGHGPLFAYSLYLAPQVITFRQYWLYIYNDIAGGDAGIQLSSPSNRLYSCNMNDFSMELGGTTGYIKLYNVHIDNGRISNLVINTDLTNSDDRDKFYEVSNFFGF